MSKPPVSMCPCHVAAALCVYLHVSGVLSLLASSASPALEKAAADDVESDVRKAASAALQALNLHPHKLCIAPILRTSPPVWTAVRVAC